MTKLDIAAEAAAGVRNDDKEVSVMTINYDEVGSNEVGDDEVVVSHLTISQE
jgi:hypothetical protein